MLAEKTKIMRRGSKGRRENGFGASTFGEYNLLHDCLRWVSVDAMHQNPLKAYFMDRFSGLYPGFLS